MQLQLNMPNYIPAWVLNGTRGSSIGMHHTTTTTEPRHQWLDSMQSDVSMAKGRIFLYLRNNYDSKSLFSRLLHVIVQLFCN